MKVLEFVVEHQEEGDKRVCEDHTPQKDQDLLADGRPWSVADTREDRLYAKSKAVLFDYGRKTHMLVFSSASTWKERGGGRHAVLVSENR